MTWRPNPGWERDQARECAPFVQAKARQAQDRAKATAPVLSGDYRNTIKVLNEPAGATLYTDDFAGHLVEFGSVRNRAHRTLTNAAINVADQVDVE